MKERYAILVSRFNPDINEGLLWGAQTTLEENGVPKDNQDVFPAPGAFEIPLLARRLAQSSRYAGIICLGSVIKGDTAHFEYISQAASQGIMQVSLETDTPVAFGILTTYKRAQAEVRSQKDEHNKGREAALACLQSHRTLSEI